jgi:glyoxylase-like metal-dependent hydrolase (beta-lactamase superfamily II)
MSRSLATLFVVMFALLAGVPAGAAELSVQTYTAGPGGFRVNSHLIAGERDAILVDAQFLLGEAARAVEMVRQSGKNLKYIVVTHGHPDHFLGLQVFRDAFPDAKIIAAADVIPDIQSYGPIAIERWKPVFKDAIPDSFITPEPANTTSLFLDGQEIQLIRTNEGESAHATVLWIPGIRALIAGDLVYNNVHLWLRENRPDAWLAILDRLEKLNPQTIYPGHGPAGGPELLAANRQYIRDFVAVTAKAVSKQEATDTLKAQYAAYELPVIVDFSVGGRMGE